MIAVIVSVTLAVGLCAALYARACRLEARPDRVLALLYHRILDTADYAIVMPASEKIFSVTETRFREQMEHLRSSGHHPVGVSDLLRYLNEGEPLPERPVLITFDDGSESVFSRALPILQEYDFPALLFVTTDPQAWCFHEGNLPQRRVHADEIVALQSAGVEIGSHAVSHQALEPLPVQEIEQELRRSKDDLEAIVGEESVRAFSVPLNWHGPKTREAAVRSGYSAMFVSDSGTIHGESDRFALKRLTVEGGYSLAEFIRALTPGGIVQRRLASRVKRLPGRLLGPRIWMPLRDRLYASGLRSLLSTRSIRMALAVGFVVLIVAIGIIAYVVVG